MTNPAFSPLLRRLMAAQDVRSKDLAAAIGVNVQSIAEWRAGGLPSMRNAALLSDALSAPSLLHIVSRARTLQCDVCKRAFIATNSGGRSRRYCSATCQQTGTSTLRRESNLKSWGKVHTRWANRYRKAQDAIDLMCNECADWEGVCRVADCPLRDLSPLPLVKERVA